MNQWEWAVRSNKDPLPNTLVWHERAKIDLRAHLASQLMIVAMAGVMRQTLHPSGECLHDLIWNCCNMATEASDEFEKRNWLVEGASLEDVLAPRDEPTKTGF